MWGRRYREFSLGAIGNGVAIGDVDDDGLPDVFISTKTGPNHLFRNLGHFRFEDTTAAAGVAGPSATEGGGNAWKQGAAFADIDNDGDLDLYVCRFAAPNLLYVNDGAGVFTEEAAARGLALVDASAMGAFCDYNRDGWIDVYVATNVLDVERRPNGQRDHLFRNHGDGTFENVTDAAGLKGETQCHAATWWDYNDDGWPDLYVDNDFRDPDQLLRNNGDGTFTNVLSWVVPHTPHSSMGADLGDINNDGRLDLLIADMATISREKDHRGMARLRVGLPDNEVRPGMGAPQYMVNTLFLGTGTSRVLEAAHLTGLAATDWTWSVRFEDLDLDGWLDLYIANGMVRELHSTDITGAMLRRESLAQRTRIMKDTPVLAEANLAFRNRGHLAFDDVSTSWGLDHLGFSTAAAFGDLDGDGDLDLVFTNYDAPATVCRNDGTAGQALVLDLRGRSSNSHGVGATARLELPDGSIQARTLVLARGYNSTSEPALFFGTGEHTRVARLAVRWPGGHEQEFDNLPTGQRYTIVEPEGPAPKREPPTPPPALFEDITAPTQLAVANRGGPLSPPAQARQPLLPFRLNRPGPFAVAADLDRDGSDELVIGGVAAETGQILTRSGAEYVSALSPVFIAPSAVPDGPIVAFDADADGDLDLLITKAGIAADADSTDYQPRLFLNSGRNRFEPAPPDMLPALPISVGAAATA
ncbi:MAG: CRTAC1 family protein, partial [Opitutaceae bacterium]|nr:CRTAC1 family protein [Opitutaceae bacterium]